jgi:uncharacterized membrane protein
MRLADLPPSSSTAGLICSAVSLLVSFGLTLFQLALTPANVHWHFDAI